MKKTVFVSFLAIALTGCAAKWSKPGSTEAEFYSDRVSCINTANNMWPVNQSPLGAGNTTPIRTNCTKYGNYVNCQQTGGQYTPPPSMDTNAIARAIEIKQCLESKGYTSQ